jgi:hypothetical protein
MLAFDQAEQERGMNQEELLEWAHAQTVRYKRAADHWNHDERRRHLYASKALAYNNVVTLITGFNPVTPIEPFDPDVDIEERWPATLGRTKTATKTRAHRGDTKE